MTQPDHSQDTPRGAGQPEPAHPSGQTPHRGRSGEGADSVLPHLREQEERRKPLSDR